MIPEFNKHLCSTYLVPGPRMGAVGGYGVGVKGQQLGSHSPALNSS